MKNTIQIGISGWSYPDWKDIFYPRHIKQSDWLQFYAGAFSTTEINASFYHLPVQQTVLNWAGKVPAGFLFCPKMSRYLTHIKKLKDAEEPLARFFNVFGPIKQQLGPVLLQLPPSLRFDSGLAKDFFELLLHQYKDYDFALEARHDSWLAASAGRLLEEYDVAWVISQSGVGFPYLEQVTARNIYFRFHGPGKLYASAYSDAMLESYAANFHRWHTRGHNLWIYFNNCYNGVAINNANTLKGLLGLSVPGA